jgi:hypothetical protein
MQDTEPGDYHEQRGFTQIYGGERQTFEDRAGG